MADDQPQAWCSAIAKVVSALPRSAPYSRGEARACRPNRRAAMLGLFLGTCLLLAGLPHAAQGGNYVVTSTNDSGPGSLRQAILDANSNIDADSITFNIPGPLPAVIRPSSELPTLQSRGGVNATTQPGYSGEPVVWLDGGANGFAYGLGSYNVTCEFRGLGVRRFNIGFILNGTDSSVYGCHSISNAAYGVLVYKPRCRVGGPGTNERNVISGNGQAGVMVDQPGSSAVIRGNYIGLAADGSNAMPNVIGVKADYTYDLTIGGSAAGEGNVISGNGATASDAGIQIRGASVMGNGFRILGNRIGTDAAGLRAVPNPMGIYIAGAGDGMIGGTGVWERNLISGNSQQGIELNGGGDAGATNYCVAGNWIGVDATGTRALANLIGLHASFLNAITIGGADPNARNLISGNTSYGVTVAYCQDVAILGNWVGLASTGTDAAGSLGIGLCVTFSTHVRVGGSTAAQRNYVCGSPVEGIYVGQGNSDLVVQGNYVGVTPVGNMALGNFYGIYLMNADEALIGGTGPGEGNVVVASTIDGIDVSGSRNVIAGNKIGCDSSVTRPMGNGFRGIRIRGLSTFTADDNRVCSNVVAWNGSSGITIEKGTGNYLQGNRIFGHPDVSIDLDDDGVTANDLGDPDTGSNERQNFPTITNAWSGSTPIEGVLNSRPLGTYRLEFFAGPETNAGGRAQAQVFLGWTNVATSAGGDASFAVHLAASAPTGWLVGATATDTNGNTSEISVGVPVVRAADADNNGIADYWETRWFGHTLGAAATNDPDGDGASTLNEYVSDTCPTNGLDCLRIRSVAVSDAVTVGFNSSAGRVYVLDACAGLPGAGWSNVCGRTEGMGGDMTLTDYLLPTHKFYRILCDLP